MFQIVFVNQVQTVLLVVLYNKTEIIKNDDDDDVACCCVVKKLMTTAATEEEGRETTHQHQYQHTTEIGDFNEWSFSNILYYFISNKIVTIYIIL